MVEQIPIGWSASGRYSPVQDRFGIKRPQPGEFPPVTERVNQTPDPYRPAFLDEREVLRVTYQGDDRCQLACPGCYTGQRLDTHPAAAVDSERRVRVPFEEFTDHLTALGPGLQEFFLLGAEPTMDPETSDAMLRWSVEHGLTVTAITNGAVSPTRFDRTFGRALAAGELYKLSVSLDSTDSATNDRLRGKPFAHERTLATIRRCVDAGAPVKVQITVWPLNYPTILDTVEELYDLGVRAFAFHCGSVEGVAEFLRHGLDHVDPLAWRALCARLYAFRDDHLDELWHFNFPLLYFTPEELREQVIGDTELTDAYLTHVDRLERGEHSAKPCHACPALDVPQVYIFANDGPGSRGTVSLCNVHSADPDTAYASYEPESRRFAVMPDPARNQMQAMIDSPHLCPAMGQATGGRRSDRAQTECGDLFHACRYLGANQIPVDERRFYDSYDEAADFYRAIGLAETTYDSAAEPYLARVRRLTDGVTSLRQRTVEVLRDAVENGGLQLARITQMGFSEHVLAELSPNQEEQRGKGFVSLTRNPR
jgi:sulfatase maturation enzyme AslB (radical SAM superfamily)